MPKITSNKAKFKTAKANLGKLWKTAKQQFDEEPDPFAPVEDGRYLARLTGGSVKRSGAKKWLHIEWIWTVTEGDYTDTKLFMRSGLETEENLVWLLRDLVKMGVDVEELEMENMEEVEALVKQLLKLKIVCRLRVQTPEDSTFTNVRIDKVVDADETEEGGEEEGEEETEEKQKKKEDKEEEEEEEVDWVGKQALYRKGKTIFVGKILSVDEDEDTFKMKTEDGEKISGPLDKLEAPEEGGSEEEEGGGEEEEEDYLDIQVGSDVKVKFEGKTHVGKVVEIDEENQKVKVKIPKLKKIVKFSADKISV